MNCTCRKHGLPCNVACKICEGATCSNTDRYSVEDIIAAEEEILDKKDDKENEQANDLSLNGESNI